LQVEALRAATMAAAAAGLTWMQDAWVEPYEVPIYLSALRAGALRVGINLAFRADPAHWRSQVPLFSGLRDEVTAAGTAIPGRPGEVTGRTVKFFVDGVIESGTASMLAPYLDCPHSSGMPLWTRPELAAAVAAFSAGGFQVHLHAIGDAAVRDALDAIEQSAEMIARRDLRPVIAHLQVIDPADLGRLASLGVIACFQPLWAQPDPLQEVLTIPRIGPARAALQYPIGSVIASGAPVSFGSDWPVTDLAPTEGIATAVTRQTPDGAPEGGWYPEERIDLRSALTAYTAGVAYQASRDAGRLTAGAVADLVWLGADLRSADPNVLRSAPVLGTWAAGVRTH
jgi:predicted amidohydrolase YtcJ